MAYELASTIAGNAPLAVQASRRVMRSALDMDDTAALELERKTAATLFQTKDAREGPLAYIEKRPPRFMAR